MSVAAAGVAATATVFSAPSPHYHERAPARRPVLRGTGATSPQGCSNAGGFCIAGETGPLLPGASARLTLTLLNPNGFAISVISLTATPGTDRDRGCRGSANLRTPIAWHAAGGGSPPFDAVTVPAAGGGQPGTATLSLTVTMLDLGTNQDACQGATIPLSYTGTAVSQ